MSPAQGSAARASGRRPARGARAPRIWILCRGGCSGRGVQWMGVVLYNKTALCNVNHYTLFPLHPPLRNVDSQSAAIIVAHVSIRYVQHYYCYY